MVSILALWAQRLLATWPELQLLVFETLARAATAAFLNAAGAVGHLFALSVTYFRASTMARPELVDRAQIPFQLQSYSISIEYGVLERSGMLNASDQATLSVGFLDFSPGPALVAALPKLTNRSNAISNWTVRSSCHFVSLRRQSFRHKFFFSIGNREENFWLHLLSSLRQQRFPSAHSPFW